MTSKDVHRANVYLAIVAMVIWGLNFAFYPSFWTGIVLVAMIAGGANSYYKVYFKEKENG